MSATSASSVTRAIGQFIGTRLAEFAVTLTVGFGPWTVRRANVSPIFVTVVDFVAARITADYHCRRWWRGRRGRRGCGGGGRGSRCGAVCATKVAIKLTVLFCPRYISPRTSLSPVVCTVRDRIFTRLAEFAMTSTVDLGPRPVSRTYVTSVLIAPFNVPTRIATGDIGSTYSRGQRSGRSYLSSSWCSCARIVSTVVTEQLAILSGPWFVNT